MAGVVWVRAAFRPEDYTAPAEALELFARWRGVGDDGETILRGRESPFANYVEVERLERDGATWVVLLEASREFAVEVELRSPGLGAVAAVPARRAYELACARDPLRNHPVRREG